jgi:hypothetical protein
MTLKTGLRLLMCMSLCASLRITNNSAPSIPRELSTAEVRKIEMDKLRESMDSKQQSLPPPTKKRGLAVIIGGLESRLLLSSMVKQIVDTSSSEGFFVHVYLDLVKAGKGTGIHDDAWSDEESMIDSADLQKYLDLVKLSCQKSNGDLVSSTLRKKKVVVPNETKNSSGDPTHITYYGLDVWENQVRQFMSYEFLMHQVMENEKQHNFKYDYVLMTRDDDHWIAPLSISAIEKQLRTPEAKKIITHKADDALTADNTLFTKAWGATYDDHGLEDVVCDNFGGLNDNVFFMGRSAAEKFLGSIYTRFWNDDENHIETNNAEAYARTFAKYMGVNLVEMPPHLLSGMPSAYYLKPHQSDASKAGICQKPLYICTDEKMGREETNPCVQAER